MMKLLIEAEVYLARMGPNVGPVGRIARRP